MVIILCSLWPGRYCRPISALARDNWTSDELCQTYPPNSLDGFCLHSDEVRSRIRDSYSWVLSDTIRRRRLSFFGHLCRADTSQDHSQALRACFRGPPRDWRHRTGRPRAANLVDSGWGRSVPSQFRRSAWIRSAWQLLMEAATSSWLLDLGLLRLERETDEVWTGTPLLNAVAGVALYRLLHGDIASSWSCESVGVSWSCCCCCWTPHLSTNYEPTKHAAL